MGGGEEKSRSCRGKRDCGGMRGLWGDEGVVGGGEEKSRSCRGRRDCGGMRGLWGEERRRVEAVGVREIVGG